MDAIIDDGAVEWPLEAALPELGGCARVAASDREALDSGAGTVGVRQGTTTYALRLVPVLPVDEACA